MKLLDTEIRVKENLMFSLTRFRLWWALFLATVVFDYLTTINFVSVDGIEMEANRVVRALMSAMGVYLGLLFAKCLQVIAVLAFASLHKRAGNIFLFFVIFLNVWAVIINTL